MRDIEFRAFNTIDKTMVQWCFIKRSFDVFLKSKHYELMQYTGLKDINGVKIFEGDIVKSDYYQPHFDSVSAIVYSEHEMKFTFDEGEQDAFKYGNLEVIGNIYEDKELLK